MSTRMRIVRMLVVSLTVLSLVSIGYGGALGAASVEPAKAFASISEVPEGTLGIGERTTAPLAEAVDAADKVSVEPSASAAPMRAITAAAVKRISPKQERARAVYARAKRPATPSHKRAVPLSARSVGGWLLARCSWYGPGFYGHTMAGGGRLTRSSMIVAHKHLPFGTRIRFWYRGRTVIAVVRDRGPYVSGRAFDLGPGTAQALGFNGVGVLRYQIIGRTKSGSKEA